MPHFDFYLIHPSIVTLRHQVQILEVINNVLITDPTAIFLIESSQNFMGNMAIKRPYSDFLSNMEKLTVLFPEKIVMVFGESIWQSAKKLIRRGNSLGLLHFPYAELRSLYFEIGREAVGKYVAFDFSEQLEVSVFDLAQSDGKLSFQNFQKVEYLPVESINNLERFSSADLFTKTVSSNLYLYEEAGQKKLFKSLTMGFTADYFCKMYDLIQVRRWFQKAGLLEALPQEIVITGNQKRGIVCNYIEGISLEKLYYDDTYKAFMTKNHYKVNIVNRILIAIALCKTIVSYHTMGIYLSDIKGDNFIVTNDGQVVPIDSDGFSYRNYYSSCPRSEMIPNPRKNRKRTFLQCASFEHYAVFVLVYRFLMAGNLPFDSEDEKCSISHIHNKSKSLYETERGQKLLHRWFFLPEYLREALYERLHGNEEYTIDILLKRLLRCYVQLSGKRMSEELVSETVKSDYFVFTENTQKDEISELKLE